MVGTTGGFPDPPPANGQPSGPGRPEEHGPPTQQGGGPYYAPPPSYGDPTAHGNPSAYGNPPAYGDPTAYGNPGAPPAYGTPPPYGNPTAYGSPAAHGGPAAYGSPTGQGDPTAYGNPTAYGSPAAYGNPNTAPQNYGYPGNATPSQAVQPYEQQPPPVAPAPYYPQTAVMDVRLVSAGGRFGALLLDGLLMLVTLWIGWAIWSLISWSNGQTPAKQLLGHVVADPNSGEAFDWGRMALREFCIKGLLGWLLNVVSFGIYAWVDAFMCLGDRQRTLHDRMANSIVRYQRP
jgi:RDD family protein